METFEIIVRRGKEKGKLFFSAANISVETTCWWDPEVKIAAAPDGYLCWRTRMARKKDSVTGLKRPGIWFGKGIKYGSGTGKSDAIFIHEGVNASWSDGCIVCDRTEIMKMWNAISESSQPNVLVKITDA